MFEFFKRKPGPSSPTPDVAIALMKRGDFDAALVEVDSLIARLPKVAMSHRFRGEVLFSLNRYDDAIRSFETAETLGGAGTEEAFFWRALAYANSGRADQAVTILREYVGSTSAVPSLAQKCQAAISAISAANSPSG